MVVRHNFEDGLWRKK